MRALFIICLVGLLGLLAVPVQGSGQSMADMDMASAAMPGGHCPDCGAGDTDPTICAHAAPCCVAGPERQAGVMAVVPRSENFPAARAWRLASVSPGIELQPPRI